MATLKSDFDTTPASFEAPRRTFASPDRDGYITQPLGLTRWIAIAVLGAMVLGGLLKVMLG